MNKTNDNMKRFLLLIAGTAMCVCADAQLARWCIHPVYDSLSVKLDNKLIQGVSGDSIFIWTMDGAGRAQTAQRVLDYREGFAPVMEKDGNRIVGFFDEDGNFTQLKKRVMMAYDNPYFCDGYMIFRNADDSYGYYTTDGEPATLAKSARAWPFHGGYAPYFAYAQPEKKKDPYYGYYKAEGKPFSTYIETESELKAFEEKDLAFLSGIGSNGKGVAVIKDRLYWFNTQNGYFEPMVWGDESLGKKRHLKLEGDYGQYFMDLPQDMVIIHARFGKNQLATLNFDKELVPVSFVFDGEEIPFAKPESKPVSYQTIFAPHSDGKLYGLSASGTKVLPPQFEEIGLCYGNKAFIKRDGKWGVVEVFPDHKCEIKINKGEVVAFRHKKFETQIRLDLPGGLSAKHARLDVPACTGCVIDKTSRESKDTDSGSYVVYDCTLNIPESLSDTVTNITYSPVNVSLNGLALYEQPITIRAWHHKSYNVDPIDSETIVANGVASFTVNINVDRNIGEPDYPFDVRVEADAVQVDYEKISETRRKFTVSNLLEGVNNLNIVVEEEGCPPAVFPFEITYYKPVPKKKKKEEVVVRKKPKAVEVKKEREGNPLKI